jgi:hypothetical protein
VEAVAAHSLGRQGMRDGERLRHLGDGAMESRVEACDLGHVGRVLQRLADRRQVVRLVQRRERFEVGQLAQQLRRDALRARV